LRAGIGGRGRTGSASGPSAGLCAAEDGVGSAAAGLHAGGSAIERVGDGSKVAERASAAGEVFGDGAEAFDADGAAHQFLGGFGVEDLGHFVPGCFVDGGDAVEIETLDEEAVEEVVKFGVHEGNLQRTKGSKSRMRSVEGEKNAERGAWSGMQLEHRERRAEKNGGVCWEKKWRGL